MKLNLAASTLPYLSKSPESAVESIAELGFKGIEIYLEGRHNLEGRKLGEIFSSYNFAIYVHAPFFDLNIASLNEEILEESKKQIKESIETASMLGSSVVTAHFGRYTLHFNSYRKKAFERNVKNAGELAEFARERDVLLCFENQTKMQSSICCELAPLKKTLEEMSKEADANLTLDVGHAHTCGNPAAYLRALGKYVQHLHFHDNSSADDEHKAIGSGDIDYKSVMKELEKLNYANAVTIEVAEEEDIVKSRNEIRKIIKGGDNA